MRNGNKNGRRRIYDKKLMLYYDDDDDDDANKLENDLGTAIVRLKVLQVIVHQIH